MQHPNLEAFDTNWAGPKELRPRVYRTQDEKDTWHAVAVENEYRLGLLGADDVVIDIGAHIGSFSYLAYRMGSRSIYAFEIDPWHYEAAEANLREMREGIGLHLAAVVRGDEHRAPQYYYNGAWNSFGAVGTPVDSLSLDEILNPHERVRFIKLDCEGGEWPILYTCTQLHQVEQIAGEWHSDLSPAARELQHLPAALSPEALTQFLYEQGFAVSWDSCGTLGHFFAKRR